MRVLRDPLGVIHREYGDAPNFMTPEVIRFGWIRRGAVAFELSRGEGFGGSDLYGVSLVSQDPTTGVTERLTKYSGCFKYLSNAELRIADMIDLFREGEE